MSVFEITIQRKDEDAWPVVVRHQPGAQALAQWSRGRLDLDPGTLDLLLPSRKEYGLLLGKALFQGDIRDAFVRAVAEAKAGGEPLRVLLNIEAEELRPLHWEKLHAPFDRGWDYLLLNQGTPFSLYLPSQIQLRFPPIGRRDLRALILVAGPEELEGDYRLASFDVAATVDSLRQALGQIPCDVLARAEGASGPPRLDVLCEQITARADSEAYTLLHVVCHGAYHQATDETLLYFPMHEGLRPVPASVLIERLGRLGRLPHLTFLSTCESADPRAEAGLGGLGQRLVRELGMPAVVAVTGRVSINTAQALTTAFYARLAEHGEADCALGQALAGLQGRADVTVPALFSRLGGRSLWSDALDRPLTGAEIDDGLAQMGALLDERAPVLKPEFEGLAATLRASLDADPTALSAETRREREAALAAANQLCSDALDLSFNALALGQEPPAYDGRCPFRGLFPFRAEDREFFFGRQALVDKLDGRLREHGFLAVLGPSGSGKSSLVLAGLVPILQQGDPPLRMTYVTPGSDPLAQLGAALAEAGGGDSGPDLVVVDQFEELFTQCRDEGERQAFVERLLWLSGRSRIVITMRADFWGECAAFPGLKDEMQDHQELVAPMDAAALRRAMERQADHVGLRFEAGLGEAILDDVEGEPGAMPLLQHALLLLWQRRHGRWLRWEEYRAIGGIQQAIAHTADEVYLGLAGQEQARMRDIFLRLTRLEDAPVGAEARDTRRRVGLAELVPAGSDPAETIALVKRLADARLMVTSLNAASGQDEAEVAHEALIRHWPRLRGWLDEDRAELHLREGVREAALEWEANDQEETYLVHRGGRLEDAEALRRQPRFALNEVEEAYVEACVGLRERERREKEAQQHRELEAARKWAEEQVASAARMRRRAIVIGAVGIVAIALAILSTLFWRQAQANAETAHARELAALSTNQLDVRLDLALLLGIEAFRKENLLQTRQALFQAWGHKPQASRFLHGHSLGVTSLAWSADGRLASGARDNTVIVWDLAKASLGSGPPAQTLEGHQDWVTSVAWLADGQLASGSTDGTVIVWDLEHGLPVQTLEGHSDGVWSVAWSADGRLASGSDDGTVIVWDLESGRPDQTLEGHAGGVMSVAWSADGRLASGSYDGTVIIWDLAKASLGYGRPALTLEGHNDPVSSVAWSADGRLASGLTDGTIIVWDLAQASLGRGQPAQILEGHAGPVISVAWSADGRLASGAEDDTVIVWDLAPASSGHGQPAQTLEGHAGGVWSVAWSVDGRLASGSEDNAVILWNLERGRPRMVARWHSAGVTSVAWSADGRLASGSWDNTVIVWDLKRDLPAQLLEGHAGRVISVAWSADGQLASGSWDNTVIVWDVESGLPVQSLEGHSGGVASVAWSADGRLASGSWDRTVQLQATDPEVWRAEACQRAGRNLTQGEWELYFPGEGYRKTCEEWPAGE
jgi:WD40 repeat protein/energy-coupling factor transporter ATP-binding protein EcfA2